MSSRYILKSFPRLKASNLILTSPRTPSYNCIAYAAGDYQRWWWPDQDGINFWPEAAQRVERLAAFQQAFEMQGYVLTADAAHEDGLEKVAIFAMAGKPTHAARQLESGVWSSKLGPSEDVSHDLPGLEGGAYGDVAFVMQRRRI